MSTNRVDEAFARHQAERGIKHPIGSDEFQAGYVEMNGIDIDNVDVGWFVTHGSERWEGGYEKCGVVVDVFERDGAKVLVVAEERTVEGDFTVRRREWKANELDPLRCNPLSSSVRHPAAKKLLRLAGRNIRVWDFVDDEFLVGAALRLTDPERERRAGQVASVCAEGHCVDAGRPCTEARDHIGLCCSCGTPVPARRAGRVVA